MEFGLDILKSLIKGALIIAVLVVALCFGIAYWLWPKQEKASTCNCPSPKQIIALHEKRIMFIDSLSYPTKQLSKKDMARLADSIAKYNQILK